MRSRRSVSPLRSPDHPLKAILREPRIKPNKDERERYVRGFVYYCGSLLRGGATDYSVRDVRRIFLAVID